MNNTLLAGMALVMLGACTTPDNMSISSRNIPANNVPAGVLCSWFNEDIRSEIMGCQTYVQTPLTPQDKLEITNFNAAFNRASSPIVNFDFGSAALRPDSQAILAQQAKWIRQNPQIHFSIFGHTDAVGSVASNFRLAEARANAVLEYLVTMGVNRAQMAAIVSYGELRPVIATNKPEELNRRVVVEVTGFMRDASSRSQEAVACSALQRKYLPSFEQCISPETGQRTPIRSPSSPRPEPFSVRTSGVSSTGSEFGAFNEVDTSGNRSYGSYNARTQASVNVSGATGNATADFGSMGSYSYDASTNRWTKD